MAFVDGAFVDGAFVDGAFVDAAFVDAVCFDVLLIGAAFVIAAFVDTGLVDTGLVDTGPVGAGLLATVDAGEGARPFAAGAGVARERLSPSGRAERRSAAADRNTTVDEPGSTTGCATRGRLAVRGWFAGRRGKGAPASVGLPG